MIMYEQIMEGVYHIGDGEGNYCTLLVGTTGALLYDTMMGTGDLRDCVAGLTDFDPMVVNSHCHFDHVGGNYQFERVYMSERDFPLLDAGLGHIPILEHTLQRSLDHLWDSFGNRERVIALAPGTILDLGGLTAEIVALPGHTPGCLGVLCRERRLLLAGDAVSPQACLFFPESSLTDYILTLHALQRMPFDTLLLSHFKSPFRRSLLPKLVACASLVGKAKWRPYAFPPIPSLGGRMTVFDLMDEETGELISIFTKDTDGDE